MRFFFLFLLAIIAVDGDNEAVGGGSGNGSSGSGSRRALQPTAVEVAGKIFDSCARFGSFTCVKPKFFKFLSDSLREDRILLTDNLSIENSGRGASERLDEESDLPKGDEMSKKEKSRFLMLQKIDHFLNSHELKIKLPREIVTGEVFPFLPKYLFDGVPKEIKVPLTETENAAEGRGLAKKVILPFLLGLKIKATTFIPIAIALIALKTWKAFTLGLLSTVLSAAMVIFKFAKPKVVNYEVYHYPHHHPAPTVEHHPYVDHHGYGRSEGGQDLAYRARHN